MASNQKTTHSNGAEFLQAARPHGSASFIGIERITGAVGERRGTYLLQDAGTARDNIVSGDWFGIPDTAPAIWPGCVAPEVRANLGESAQVHLDYWFE